MKTFLVFVGTLLLMGNSFFSIAQKPIYPKPNNGDNIGVGKKPHAPVSRKNQQMPGSWLSKEMFNLYGAHFDPVSKKMIANRDRPGSPAQQIALNKSKKVQAAKKPVNQQLDFHLTKDINTFSESNPENSQPKLDYSFAVLDNVAYFSANDGIHGQELWRSDGTSAGTYLVKDINPGETGYHARGIIAANGLLFFGASTDENGSEPWISDGTAAGTHILRELAEEANSSFPHQFVNVNGTVFFVASSLFSSNSQLWKTDGTEGGTEMVKDLAVAGIGDAIMQLTAVNNMIFFTAFTHNSGFQLFRSDGTDAGTYLVKETGYDGYGDSFTAPMQLTSYDNKLFFSVNDGSGRKLWVSDGSFEGTNYAQGSEGIYMQDDYMEIDNNISFSILDNVLFIAAYTENDGGGLYKYDASNNTGIVLVKDLTAVADFLYDEVFCFIVPAEMTIVNGKMYFKVISTINGWHEELWTTDGITNNTQLFKTIVAGEAGSYAWNFYNGNGVLYFVVKGNPLFGNELWRSDGTDEGTMIVKDINDGRGNADPDNLTFVNGKLLFRASEFVSGIELWQSDGTAAGTSLVKDINTTTNGGSSAGFYYMGLSALGNDVLFNAFTPALGAELYRSDGTETGTVLLNDIWSGQDWSYPNSFLYKNKVTYFISDNEIGTSLYKTDGTSAGLQRVTAYINRNNYSVHNFNVSDKGQLFYLLYNWNTDDRELWYSDGSSTSGMMLKAGLIYDPYIVMAGNIAFFAAGDNEHGFELWKSDGTPAGTRLVKDINPGPDGSAPYSLFECKNKIYFGAYDGNGFNYSLWQTNGEEKGTIKIKNVAPAYYYYPGYPSNPTPQVFCISKGMLYFGAISGTSEGDGLWRTNGTTAGTELVKNINPYYSSDIYNLTDVNGTLFFTADDGIHGVELWKSNGSENGTVLVKDISPGNSSGPFNLCNVGGELYFKSYFTSPNLLWTSDGTEANTVQVVDDVLNSLSFLGYLIPAGNKLYFGGYSEKYGTELYVGEAGSEKLSVTSVSASKVVELKPNASLNAALFPNPTKGSASLQLSGDLKNVSITITDISGKAIWNKVYNNQQTINLPMQKRNAGTYIITVKNNKESKSLKLVKQ